MLLRPPVLTRRVCRTRLQTFSLEHSLLRAATPWNPRLTSAFSTTPERSSQPADERLQQHAAAAASIPARDVASPRIRKTSSSLKPRASEDGLQQHDAPAAGIPAGDVASSRVRKTSSSFKPRASDEDLQQHAAAAASSQPADDGLQQHAAAASIDIATSPAPNAPAPFKSRASMKDALRVLRRGFGHQDFRPEQEAVVSRILAGQDVLMVRLHASGRFTSYITPIIAEALRTPADSRKPLTIVVVPHEDMWDQVPLRIAALNAMGISTAELRVTATRAHEQAVNDAVRQGSIHVLFFHPKKLLFPEFSAAIHHRADQGELRLVVVERAARTLSTLGEIYATRNRTFSEWLNALPRRPAMVCLLGPDSIHPTEDVCRALDVSEATISTHLAPLPRKLHVRTQAVERNHDKFPALLTLLAHPNGSEQSSIGSASREGKTLIWVNHPEQAVKLAERLRNEARGDFDAVALIEDSRYGLQVLSNLGHAWSRAGDRVTCDATVAKKHAVIVTAFTEASVHFPNIRHGIIYSVPGQAYKLQNQLRVVGLDGEPSSATVILTAEEIFEAAHKIRSRGPSLRDIRSTLKEIFSGREGQVLPIDDAELSSSFDLEIRSQIQRHIAPYPELKQYATISPQINAFSWYVKDPAGRTYWALRTQEIERDVAARHPPGWWQGTDGITFGRALRGPPDHALLEQLHTLHEQGIIRRRIPRQNLQPVKIQRLPNAEEFESLARGLHSHMHQGIQQTLDKRAQFFNLFHKNRCLISSLSDAKGWLTPVRGRKCGNCEYCLTGTNLGSALVTWTPKKGPRYDDWIKRVMEIVPTDESPRLHARFAIGTPSPRIIHLGLNKHRNFGCMRDGGDFNVLLRVFARKRGIPEDQLDEY